MGSIFFPLNGLLFAFIGSLFQNYFVKKSKTNKREIWALLLLLASVVNVIRCFYYISAGSTASCYYQKPQQASNVYQQCGMTSQSEEAF